jgi:hypothetical protein
MAARVLAKGGTSRTDACPLLAIKDAENGSQRMTDETRFPRIYALLRAAGHDAAQAAEIVSDAQRKDDHARAWIKAIVASRRPVLQAPPQMRKHALH